MFTISSKQNLDSIAQNNERIVITLGSDHPQSIHDDYILFPPHILYKAVVLNGFAYFGPTVIQQEKENADIALLLCFWPTAQEIKKTYHVARRAMVPLVNQHDGLPEIVKAQIEATATAAVQSAERALLDAIRHKVQAQYPENDIVSRWSS